MKKWKLESYEERGHKVQMYARETTQFKFDKRPEYGFSIDGGAITWTICVVGSVIKSRISDEILKFEVAS